MGIAISSSKRKKIIKLLIKTVIKIQYAVCLFLLITFFYHDVHWIACLCYKTTLFFFTCYAILFRYKQISGFCVSKIWNNADKLWTVYKMNLTLIIKTMLISQPLNYKRHVSKTFLAWITEEHISISFTHLWSVHTALLSFGG